MARDVHNKTVPTRGRRYTMTTKTTMGEFIEIFFSELVKEYGDEDLAEVIASTLINEMILAGLHVDQEIAAA